MPARWTGLELDSRSLDPRGSLSAHQCPGALDGFPQRARNQDPVRQLIHQPGMRSAALEASHVLQWAERFVPALSAVHIPGV